MIEKTAGKCCCVGLLNTKNAMILIIAVFAGEFIATHIPAAKMPRVYYSDKTLHLIAYAVLGAVFILGLLVRGTRLRNIIFTGVIFFPLYGCFDEITQPLVNRTADYRDWRMDMFGSIGAMLLIALCVMIWRKLRKKPNSKIEIQ